MSDTARRREGAFEPAFAYEHVVRYYETDRMGVVHHSNYIRFMEEARTEYLRGIGFDLLALERDGIVSPVVSVECRYRQTTTFDDRIVVRLSLDSYSGVKIVFSYEMRNAASDEVVCTASSTHCFVDEHGKPLNLRKRFLEMDRFLREAVAKRGGH